jgi:hypothetical protein
MTITIFINIAIFLNLSLVMFKFMVTKFQQQKIICFYFAFTQLIILILLNWAAKPGFTIDIALLLFVLELVVVLFLLYNKRIGL